MTATTDLLDLYKERLGYDSDNAAAKSLGLSRQTLSNWRVRLSQGEPYVIERICAALDMESGPWLLRLLSEQADKDVNRKVWRSLRNRAQFGLYALLSAMDFGARFDELCRDCSLLVDTGFLPYHTSVVEAASAYVQLGC